MKSTSHIGHYIVLLAILGLGFFLVIAASHSKQLQMAIVVLASFFYVVWGLCHHLISHDLSAKIVIEYILIACFGIAAVFFLLKGALF